MARIFLFFFFIIIASILIIVTIFKNKKSLLIKEIVAMIIFLTFFYYYCFNSEFYILVRSNVFPQNKCVIYDYNNLMEHKKISINLPPNSVFLFRSPESVFYSKCNQNKCIKFFNKDLNIMKKNNLIKSYSYNEKLEEFDVLINNQVGFTIKLIKHDGVNDIRKYSVSIIKNNNAY